MLLFGKESFSSFLNILTVLIKKSFDFNRFVLEISNSCILEETAANAEFSIVKLHLKQMYGHKKN